MTVGLAMNDADPISQKAKQMREIEQQMQGTRDSYRVLQLAKQLRQCSEELRDLVRKKRKP